MPTRADALPVVGLGGSAGGVGALQAFFSRMPADSGMAFVVVLHLSPEHESTLASILQRTTAMPVVQVSGPTLVATNHVYVIPPGKHLTLINGSLYTSPMKRQLGRHVAVDLLFRSLADSQGPRAMAVVLSGADGDGCIGIKRVKEHGGLTVAQNPQEAEHDGMPRSAIATGMVDLVLPVAEIPERLVEYLRREKRVRLPGESQPTDGPTPPDEAGDEAALREALALLRTRVGTDFSHYNRATVLRRIGRRMQVHGIEDLEDYRQLLRAHPGEAGALLHDLLISVTNFFRDRDAFAALEAEIPRLFEGKADGDTVRVWVAGCATGEEAYSVAMLLLEHASGLPAPPRVQVFATDLNEAAISAARSGFYPDTIIADVSPERLERFFSKETHGYRVRGKLRETVQFATHDLLRDAPFSRLDLVSCRNLLIYLNRETQERAFDVFHYALRAEGVLFLGTTDSADDAVVLFNPQDKKHRLYIRRATARQVVPLTPGLPSLALSRNARAGSAFPEAAAVSIAPVRLSPNVSNRSEHSGPWSGLHFRLLERYAPPRSSWMPTTTSSTFPSTPATSSGSGAVTLPWTS